jgi:hypothetical protein
VGQHFCCFAGNEPLSRAGETEHRELVEFRLNLAGFNGQLRNDQNSANPSTLSGHDGDVFRLTVCRRRTLVAAFTYASG